MEVVVVEVVAVVVVVFVVIVVVVVVVVVRRPSWNQHVRTRVTWGTVDITVTSVAQSPLFNQGWGAKKNCCFILACRQHP